MPFADALTPPLTTVRIAVHEMGEEAARLLLRQIDKPGSDAVTVQLTPQLIVRGSTAAPRDGAS
ncbi:transcriptional repressor RbsR [compost metagenome]